MTSVEYHRTVMTRPERDDRFLGEIREFVAAIKERRAPSITGMDGRAALATALALYESARTGQPVTV
jgi:predicted dehydrogenase